MTNENFEDLEENIIEYIVSDEKTEWQILVIRENGIIRVWNFDEIKKENTWLYKQIDATKKVVFVDYDVNSVKPIVKSILNEVANFPEMILLSQIRLIILIIAVIASVSLYLDYTSFKQADASTMYKSMSEALLKQWLIKTPPPTAYTGSVDNF